MFSYRACLSSSSPTARESPWLSGGLDMVHLSDVELSSHCTGHVGRPMRWVLPHYWPSSASAPGRRPGASLGSGKPPHGLEVRLAPGGMRSRDAPESHGLRGTAQRPE